MLALSATSTRAPPLVVVAVLHWNTLRATGRCLRALRTMNYPNACIVLVDNASGDDSVAGLITAFPEVTVLRNRSNLGFAAGHVVALEFAQARAADAIWLVNSDAEVSAGALDDLVAAWQTRGDGIYGAAPVQRHANGDEWLNFPGKYLDPDGRPGAFQRDTPIKWTRACQQGAAFQVGAVAGSCMLIPLALVRAHGWLDPAWFMYCEEIDYCYRLRCSGVRAWLVPHADVVHGGGGSQGDSLAVADCMLYYRTRNEIVLTLRHGGRVIAALVAFKKLLRAAATVPRDRRRAALVWRGLWDALRGRMGKTLAPERFYAV